MKTQNRIAPVLASLGVVIALATFVQGQTLQINPVAKTYGIVAQQGGAIASSGANSLGLVGSPASYDLRNVGYVTSVKNQGSVGSCWAFATYGAMESEILVAGGATYNFSENNLKNRHGFDWTPNEGGNYNMSMAYLSRLSGPGLETDDPYDNSGTVPSSAPTTIPRQRFLTAANFYDTTAEIKNAVVTKGALATYMYYDSNYYNSSTQTYCYTGNSTSVNHGVTIAGWSDAKSAWLVKNSWGTSWGDNGYFWVSYNDKLGCKEATSFETTAADTVKSVYYHDKFGEVDELNTPYACNVFHTTAADTLKSVGFYTQQDGADYEIRIYADWKNGAPSDLLDTVTGTIDNWGYHVVNLHSLISVNAQDDFVVYLKITNDGTYCQAIDYAVADYSSTSVASAGESYYSVSGSTWTDLTSWNPTANFSIKVFGVPEPGICIMLLGLAAMSLVWLAKKWLSHAN